MKIRSVEDEWKEYTIYFDGVRDTRAIEADTDHQFIVRIDNRTNKWNRFYGNVQLVNDRTGVVYGCK